jgi:hypothetical protein
VRFRGAQVSGSRSRAGAIMDDRAEEVALLAAQIAADHPTLSHALRNSVALVCHFADRLEAELRTYEPLEAILNSAVHCVEARTGRHVDEELLMLLLDRCSASLQRHLPTTSGRPWRGSPRPKPYGYAPDGATPRSPIDRMPTGLGLRASTQPPLSAPRPTVLGGLRQPRARLRPCPGP